MTTVHTNSSALKTVYIVCYEKVSCGSAVNAVKGRRKSEEERDMVRIQEERFSKGQPTNF